MRLSVTLPSIYPDSLERTLNNLNETTTKHELEVFAVTPFEVDYKLRSGKVHWIKDVKRDGCNSAHFEASKYVTSELIVAFSDDHLFIDGWDDLAVENFIQRESKCSKRPFLLGLRQRVVAQHIGTVFGIYYPYFPMMRTEDVVKIGGWLSPEYKHGFGDPDLGLRVWNAGGYAEWMLEPIITVLTEEDDARHRERGQIIQNDMELFVNRWKPKYGAGWNTDHLRGFNVDIPLSLFGPDERSCYRNDRV